MENKKPISVLRISFVAALGGFLFGYDTGVIGGTQLFFTEYFELSPAMQGLTVGSAIYACGFGAIIAGFLTNMIGRKNTLIFSAILFSVSAWGSGIADSTMELIVYRVIGGLGIGLASMAAPMYIAEVSPAKVRGRMVALYQLAIVLGFFFVFLATYFIGGGSTEGLDHEALLANHSYNLNQGWRVMFWSELPVALAFFALLFMVPASPRWLALKGRSQEAMQTLVRLTGSKDQAEREMQSIEASLAQKSISSIKVLLANGLGVAIIIGILLSIFQQTSGINAILYYGAEIFSNAPGYGPQDALKQQLWLGAVNLAFTFIAIYTVDIWGRKPLYQPVLLA